MNILNILNIVNNNVGVVILVTGFFVIYIYIKQRKDKKRDAARLILQEIGYAEQQIRNSGRGSRGYSLSSKLLPINSWNDNVHLFIKELKETQIDMISEFYSNATYIDFLIIERSKQKLNQQFAFQPPFSVSSRRKSGKKATPNFQSRPTQQEIVQIMQLPNPNEQIAIQILRDISSNIEFLYNTPVVEKLKRISEKEWYEL